MILIEYTNINVNLNTNNLQKTFHFTKAESVASVALFTLKIAVRLQVHLNKFPLHTNKWRLLCIIYREMEYPNTL